MSAEVKQKYQIYCRQAFAASIPYGSCFGISWTVLFSSCCPTMILHLLLSLGVTLIGGLFGILSKYSVMNGLGGCKVWANATVANFGLASGSCPFHLFLLCLHPLLHPSPRLYVYWGILFLKGTYRTVSQVFFGLYCSCRWRGLGGLLFISWIPHTGARLDDAHVLHSWHLEWGSFQFLGSNLFGSLYYWWHWWMKGIFFSPWKELWVHSPSWVCLICSYLVLG